MLDAFDVKILRTWQTRGDIGPVQMAEVINLSASQCSRRMQRLRQDGYVVATRVILDPARINIGIFAYVMLKMTSHSPRSAESFRTKMLAIDEVIECQKLAGSADMILKVATHDLDSFNRLLTKQILGAAEVSTAQSSIILENEKSTTNLPLDYAIG